MIRRVPRCYAPNASPARRRVRQRTFAGPRCSRAHRGTIRPENALQALQALTGLEARNARNACKARTLFAAIATAWVALFAADGTANAADAAMARTVGRAEVAARTESVAAPSAAVVPVILRQIVQSDPPQWRMPRPDVAIAGAITDDAASLDRAIEPPVAPSSHRASARVIRGYDAAGPPSPVVV
jgi:hypothetical protein